ncbi:MAG: hypothetical protein ACE5F4_00530 [Candidatus Paceibacteria bacterium]
MKEPRGAAGGDLIFFIFFIVVLGIVWALTGGPDRAISREGPFLNPPFPLGNESAYSVPGVSIPLSESAGSRGGSQSRSGSSDTLSDIISRVRSGFSSVRGGDSPYAGLVTLSAGRARLNTPDEEYITLKTSRNVEGRIVISDWRIESAVTLAGTTIGDASGLPFSGRVNTEDTIALGPSATVYLVTGRAPIGASFRVNTCTGYFAQFQEFNPDLDDACPFPEDELALAARTDFVPNDTCIEFVENINRCTLTLSAIPPAVGAACQDFILNDLSYSGCVDAHRSDPGFFKNEWRIYLDRDQELWKEKNERITLIDENGLVVDSISY